MQLPKIAMTTDGRFSSLLLPMVEKTHKRAAKTLSDPKPVRHPEFGRTLDTWMKNGKVTNAELAKQIGDKNGELIARYRRGEMMPRPDKLKRLADAMGMTPAELRGEGSPQVLASMLDASDINLSEDEHRLLKAYRKMKPVGQKSIRMHAGRLLEQQGVADRDNPFGRGKPN